MVDRSALRHAYRPDENRIVEQRLSEAALSSAQAKESAALARSLSKAVREHKPAGIDAFMAAYDLGSDEGIALMCLAEALLRIPDAETADDLIADKLAGPNWAEKLGESSSPFVNAATFSLLLTGKVLDEANDKTDNWRAALGRAVGRLGEPVIRTAVSQAMKILGKQFVFGRTIDEALKRAAPEQSRGWSHSFDMLGEAAKTHADAARYAKAYADALGVTPDHLSRTCRKTMSKPALQVLQDRLMLEARRLLAYTPMPVAEVADQLGYADPAYFTKSFARSVGHTPSEYRALVAQGVRGADVRRR